MLERWQSDAVDAWTKILAIQLSIFQFFLLLIVVLVILAIVYYFLMSRACKRLGGIYTEIGIRAQREVDRLEKDAKAAREQGNEDRALSIAIQIEDLKCRNYI